MMIDLNFFSEFYQINLPSGYESPLASLLFPRLRALRYECVEDKLHNLVVHKEGWGKKIAVCVPTDSHSFTIRYSASEEKRAYIHTEYVDSQQVCPAAGETIVFDNGQSAVLRSNGAKKLYISTENPGEFPPGTAGALKKQFHWNAEDEMLIGVEIDSAVCMYVLGMLLEQKLQLENEIYFVFSARNKVLGGTHQGLVHALSNIRPDRTIWLGTTQSKEDRLIVEVGSSQYMLEAELIKMVRGLPPDKAVARTNVLGAVLPTILEATATPAVGLAIPIRGTPMCQQIRGMAVRNAKELTGTLLTQLEHD